MSDTMVFKKDITVDKVNNRVIMYCNEPAQGVAVTELSEWLAENNSDKDLARVFADVCTEAGFLGHEVNDPENSQKEIEAYEILYDIWWEFELELVEEIKNRLRKQKIPLPNENNGFYKIVESFMEQNGYYNGSGWWIKADTN